MAVTVIPGEQGGQGNADNVLSVMNSINQRRKEIEQQQRGMEYEFINNYAASHGGFAGISAMPGGDKMLQHYATNVMGYSPEVVPEFQKAIEQGYNPDEALYQINNNLAFTRSQQTGQNDQIVETQQTGPRLPGVNTGDVSPDVINRYAQPVEPRQRYSERSGIQDTGQRGATRTVPQETGDVPAGSTAGMREGQPLATRAEQENVEQRRQEAQKGKWKEEADYEITIPEDQV